MAFINGMGDHLGIPIPLWPPNLLGGSLGVRDRDAGQDVLRGSSHRYARLFTDLTSFGGGMQTGIPKTATDTLFMHGQTRAGQFAEANNDVLVFWREIGSTFSWALAYVRQSATTYKLAIYERNNTGPVWTLVDLDGGGDAITSTIYNNTDVISWVFEIDSTVPKARLWVEESVEIVSSSVANPTVITTSNNHNLSTNDSVTIYSHAGSTPEINGTHTVTRLTDTTFTIPVNVTVGGTAGSVDDANGLENDITWTETRASMNGMTGEWFPQVMEVTGAAKATLSMFWGPSMMLDSTGSVWNAKESDLERVASYVGDADTGGDDAANDWSRAPSLNGKAYAVLCDQRRSLMEYVFPTSDVTKTQVDNGGGITANLFERVDDPQPSNADIPTLYPDEVSSHIANTAGGACEYECHMGTLSVGTPLDGGVHIRCRQLSGGPSTDITVKVIDDTASTTHGTFTIDKDDLTAGYRGFSFWFDASTVANWNNMHVELTWTSGADDDFEITHIVLSASPGIGVIGDYVYSSTLNHEQTCSIQAWAGGTPKAVIPIVATDSADARAIKLLACTDDNKNESTFDVEVQRFDTFASAYVCLYSHWTTTPDGGDAWTSGLWNSPLKVGFKQNSGGTRINVNQMAVDVWGTGLVRPAAITVDTNADEDGCPSAPAVGFAHSQAAIF